MKYHDPSLPVRVDHLVRRTESPQMAEGSALREPQKRQQLDRRNADQVDTVPSATAGCRAVGCDGSGYQPGLAVSPGWADRGARAGVLPM